MAASRATEVGRGVESWRDLAACVHEDPGMFFPSTAAVEGYGYGTYARATEAVLVCGRCPVAGECLEWALETKQEFGIWGGLTPKQRQAELARRAREAKRSRIGT